MKRKPPKPPGTKVAMGRWPGAGSQGVRKAIVTNRNKKLKVTLPKLDIDKERVK